jgi:hypothetical protein
MAFEEFQHGGIVPTTDCGSWGARSEGPDLIADRCLLKAREAGTSSSSHEPLHAGRFSGNPSTADYCESGLGSFAE